jgi:tetratricopeptide (TPR) repeat protein
MIRALVLLLVLLAAPARADDAKLDALFAALAHADADSWQGIEDQIWAEWSEAGSPAMDLLLQRGREALAAGNPDLAIDHLTALVENAPDFAEGWNARATAYYQAGELGLAVSDLAHALALEPRHFGALTGLGVILEDTGDLKDALGAYQDALAIHPFRPDLRQAVKRVEAELQGKAI